MSEILYCKEVVHDGNYLDFLGGVPRPKAELLVAYRAALPKDKNGAISSETQSRQVCTRCWERIEQDLDAMSKSLKSVVFTIEVSPI